MTEELQKKVPKAIFLEKVQEACKKEGTQNLLAALDQQYNKYNLVEGQLQRSSQSMTIKIPELQKTILMIDTLQKNPTTEVDFLLSDGIFVKGKPKQNLQTVSLWLGASTIVELSFAQANVLLSENLSNAKTSLKKIKEEMTYIKDQKTTTEVNVARVYNYSILEKRQDQLEKSKEEEQ